MAEFKKLLKIDTTDKTVPYGNEGLITLPWATAWQMAMENSEQCSFEVIHSENGYLYHCDDMGNCWVETEVEIDGAKRRMHRPILNEYGVDIPKGEITSMDVNTAIMRCLVKNLALFGIGLSLYQTRQKEGDNEPTEPENTNSDKDEKPSAPVEEKTTQTTAKRGRPAKKKEIIPFSIENATDEQIKAFFNIPFPIKWQNNKGRMTAEIINMILPTKEDKEQKMKNKDELMSSLKWCIDNDRMPKIDAPFDISFKEYCSTIKFFAHDPKFFVEKIKML